MAPHPDKDKPMETAALCPDPGYPISHFPCIFKQSIQSDKKLISYLFNIQSFLEIKECRVFALEPVWLNLQCIRIDLRFPEPFCTTELDVFRIDIRDLTRSKILWRVKGFIPAFFVAVLFHRLDKDS